MKKNKNFAVFLLIYSFVVIPIYSENKRISANYILKIQELLKAKKTVSLIIYIPIKDLNILTTPPIKDKPSLDGVKDAVSQKIYSGTVRILNGYFGETNEFNIINRDQLQTILKEQELYQTGLLADDSRIKVGELIGANYILSISHTMSMNQTKKTFLTITKLIEISTGKELTSDEASIIVKTKEEKDIYSYYFNGKEIQMVDGKMFEK